MGLHYQGFFFMSISSQTADNNLTINISGRFDFSVHREFRAVIDTINADTRHIFVDLRATEYVDSSALGMLLMLKSKMGDQKDKVSLINTRPEVQKILDIANFDQLFNVN